MGIVYQPTFIVADAVADGRLEILALDHPPFDLGNIYAVYPPNEHLPAKVRVFIDFLIKRFSGTPPWQRRIDQTIDRTCSPASVHTGGLITPHIFADYREVGSRLPVKESTETAPPAAKN